MKISRHSRCNSNSRIDPIALLDQLKWIKPKISVLRGERSGRSSRREMPAWNRIDTVSNASGIQVSFSPIVRGGSGSGLRNSRPALAEYFRGASIPPKDRED